MGTRFHDGLPVKNVTPYIHILAKHIPEFIQKYKNVSQFSQPGLEKLNNQTTLDFARSTNHDYHSLAALTQLMQKRNRIEYLESNGLQRTCNKVTCSACKEKGHNRRTCEKSIYKISILTKAVYVHTYLYHVYMYIVAIH